MLHGKVTRVEKFGVFVSTPKGDGLVPIRELGLPPGADHRRMFPPGKELDIVVIDVNAAGKMRFSATQVARVEEANNFREFAKGQKTEGETGPAAEPSKVSLGSLGDVLRRKLNLPEPAPAAAKPPQPEARSAPTQSTPSMLRTGDVPKPPDPPPAKSRRRVR